MRDTAFWREVAEAGDRVLLRPVRLLPWDSIVNGVTVCAASGEPKRMEAVSKNTWRAHHRIDKDREGSGAVYRGHFTREKERLIGRLGAVRSQADLEALSTHLLREIRPLLTNLRESIRASYNSLRKPVDLYLQHLVAMAREVDPASRERLVPLLALPLDSQMLNPFALPGGGEYSIFSVEQLRRLGLTRASSYGHVRTEAAHRALQDIVAERAAEVAKVAGRAFPPIYFDMLWNGRYRRRGGNLFETNP